MKRASQPLVLLGPQRLAPTLKDAISTAGVGGPLAAITAGWEEREAEDDELREHVGGRSFNLELHRRAMDVFARDPELHSALGDRSVSLARLRELYRLRLAHALEAARELLGRADEDRVLEDARASAIAAVRRIDREHLAAVEAVNAEFREKWKPGQRAEVARHREEVAQRAEEAAGICVAGGHVGILLNRLRLFDLAPLLRKTPVFAWSAGAMALCSDVVLFHDSPAQGPGDAEVLGPGLGIAPGLVALPHAKRRLRLEDRARVALFARRFAPDVCAVLDERTRVDWDGSSWRATEVTRRLCVDGSVEGLVAA